MLGLSLPSWCKARLSIPSQDTTGTRQLFPILYTAHISLLTPLIPSPRVLPSRPPRRRGFVLNTRIRIRILAET